MVGQHNRKKANMTEIEYLNIRRESLNKYFCLKSWTNKLIEGLRL